MEAKGRGEVEGDLVHQVVKMHVLMRRLHNEEELLRNHLKSIKHDSQWVEFAEAIFEGLPMVANLRNGEWYRRDWEAFSYFKSGDGHNGKWSFSYTRLNLHVAVLAARRSGCVIVDSTRRGKRFPDSMSATIPIWCAMINAVVLGDRDSFVAPPWMPQSQEDAIKFYIETFLSNMPNHIKSMIQQFISPHNLHRLPYVPVWASPSDGTIDIEGDGHTCDCVLEPSSSRKLKFIPVILLSVSEDRSERDHREEGFSWFYVKGAGDDEENWCRGLQANEFWKHEDSIFESDDPHQVEEVVDSIVKGRGHEFNMSDSDSCIAYQRLGESNMYYNIQDSSYPHAYPQTDQFFQIHAAVVLHHDATSSLSAEFSFGWIPKEHSLHIYLDDKNKMHSKDYWQQVFRSCEKLYQQVQHATSLESPTLLVYAMSDDCHCAKIALLNFFLLRFGAECSGLRLGEEGDHVSKADVQAMSGWVQSVAHKAALSRPLLKELTRFFVTETSARNG